MPGQATVKLIGTVDLLGTVYRPGTVLNADAFTPEALQKLLDRGVVVMVDGAAPPVSREDAPRTTNRPEPYPGGFGRPTASQRRPAPPLAPILKARDTSSGAMAAPKFEPSPAGAPAPRLPEKLTKVTGVRRIALDGEV